MRSRENKTCACENKLIFQIGCVLPTPGVSELTEIQSEKPWSAGLNFLSEGQFCISTISGIAKKKGRKRAENRVSNNGIKPGKGGTLL